jgi:hypothetical protein
MDKKQTRTLDSEVSTQSKLDQNAPLFAGFSQYPAIKAEIDAAIAKALDLSKQKLNFESLTSAPKTNSRFALVNASLNLSSKVKSLAYINGNSQLYDSVKMTKSSIRLLTDSLFLQKSDLLADAAEDNKTELAEYGETPATIAAYKARRDTFKAEVGNMADIQEQLANVTEQLTQQLKQNEKLFKKVDTLVNSMSESQPAFYNVYWTARAVKPTGSSKVAVKVKAFVAGTNQPLPGSILTVTRIENGKALTSGAELVKSVKITSAGGGANLKGLTTGGYIFTVKYAGCNDQVNMVYVNEGVLTRVDMPLNKIS